MNSYIKHAVLASLAIGGPLAAAVANAGNVVIADPTSGSSSLVFFINDESSHDTYALVLNQTVGQEFTYATGTGNTAAVTTYTADSGFSLNVGADPGLTSFLTSAGNDTLQWGVIGGTKSPTAATSTAGGSVVELTSTVDADVVGIARNNISGPSGVLSANAGLAGDIETLATQTAETGFNAAAASNGAAAGVIGTAASKSGVAVTLYGNDGGVGGNPLTSAINFYALTVASNTVSGSTSKAVAFDLGSFSLSGAGAALDLIFAGNSGGGSSVPLPPAVWMFGSGLLALAGVARRRKAGELLQGLLATHGPELI